MEEKNFTKESGIFTYPKLVPLRFFLNYDPPQLGMMYKRSPLEKKKHLFLIQLNGLILLGDPEKITQILYEKYPAFINEDLVNPMQIYNLISKMLEYIQDMLLQYQDNEDEEEVTEEVNVLEKQKMVCNTP